MCELVNSSLNIVQRRMWDCRGGGIARDVGCPRKQRSSNKPLLGDKIGL